MKKIISILMFCIGFANITNAETTNLTGIDNVIYIKPFSASAGEVKKLSICMKNTAEIRGFQFNLYLPEGVTIAQNAKGKTLASLSSGRRGEFDEHTLSVGKQEDGSFLFLCGSLSEDTFLGNDGEIATVTLNISSNISKGEYPVIIKNQKLTENDISKYYEKALVESSLNIDVSSLKVVLAEEDSLTDGKYLKNGKLIIKKDNKEYDAAGAIK